MKILLVTQYWYPWNCSGAFRWVHIGEHLDFDVLTSKKPRGAMYDETMPGWNKRVFRYGSNLPAVLGGLYLSVVALFHRNNYDRIIFTSPPESILIGAWLLQKVHKGVYVDMRDEIGRTTNTNKWRILSPVWRWFYKRLKNRVAVNEVITEYDQIIRHGYMDLDVPEFWQTNWCFCEQYLRHSYWNMRNWLQRGIIPNYTYRPKDRTPSTFYTLRKYFKNLPKHFDDQRMYDWPLYSYKEIAQQWQEYLEGEK